MTYKQFIAVIKARWLTVAICLVATVSIAVLASLLLPAKYKSTGAVVIDIKSPDPINGMVVQGNIAGGYIATQVSVIQSERVTRKVIKSLRLDESPVLLQQWRDETDSNGDFQSWLSDILVRKLEVTPARDASVIEITYASADPKFAAAMAAAYIQAYLDTTVELRIEPAKRFTGIFDEQIRQSREKLEAAQARLSDAQKDTGLLVTDERLDVENNRLAELTSQVVQLQALSAESGSRKAQTGANTIEVLNNPVISNLKSLQAQQEARLKEVSAQMGPAHPQVLQLQANISELKAKIDAEIARVASSVGINNTVAQSREGQARAALQAQREKLLKLRAQRDQVSVLQRDVENAQRSYDTLQARALQTSMESQATQTNVSLLRAPTPPSLASFPKLWLNTVVSVFLGALLGIGLALFNEMRRRRLRSEEDIVNLLNVPMMGLMPFAAEANPSKKSAVGSALRLQRRGNVPELSAPGNN